jgi:hypothetical protein
MPPVAVQFLEERTLADGWIEVTVPALAGSGI